MWGYGGSLTIHNETDQMIERLNKHSYQMKKWEPPSQIQPGESVKIDLVFNKNPFKVVADDACNVTYVCRGSRLMILSHMKSNLKPYFEFICDGSDHEVSPNGIIPFIHNGNVDLFLTKIKKSLKTHYTQTLTDLNDMIGAYGEDSTRSAISSIGDVANSLDTEAGETVPEAIVLNVANCFLSDNKNICFESERCLTRILDNQGFTLPVFQKLVDLLSDQKASEYSSRLFGKAYHEVEEGDPPAIPGSIITQIDALCADYTINVCGNAAKALGCIAEAGMLLVQAQVDAITGILDSTERSAYPKALIAIAKLDINQPPITEATEQKILDLTKDLDPLINKAAADAIGVIAKTGNQTLP